MKQVKIVGVPEHFNLPWHLCIENGEFEEVSLDVQWTNVPEGTGKMCQMLGDNQTDMAIILTEGIVKDILQGNPSTIVQTYVQSSLVWGVHVSANSNIKDISELDTRKIAISRYGSGSHLMSYVLAQQNNMNTHNLQFEVINNLDGAVHALANKEADYFLWEKFTTKPLVDKGVFNRVADCPTPWPCFVIAVRNEFLEKNKTVVKQILEILNTTTSEFKIIPSIDRMLAVRYDLELQDVKQWMSQTIWSQKNIDQKTLHKVILALQELNLIEKNLDTKKVVTNI